MLTDMPSFAVGSLTPYLPKSPVTEPDTMYSVAVVLQVAGTVRYASCAGVMEFGVQIFQGTQVGAEPFKAAAQTGAPAATPATPPVAGFGTTCNALSICGWPRKLPSMSPNCVIPTFAYAS